MREPSPPRRMDTPPGRGSRRQLPACSARALALWPRLDRARLARTGGDPARIARLVMSRSSVQADEVIAILTKEPRVTS
jgi:hypothetical protein